MEKRKQHSARVRERRLRARYKRNLKIAIVLSLLIGLAAGFAAGRLTAPAQEIDAPATADLPTPTALSTPDAAETAQPTAVPTQVPAQFTDEPTQEPADEPADEPTQAPTDEPAEATAATEAPEATEAPIEVPSTEPEGTGTRVVISTLLPTVEPSQAPSTTAPEATPAPEAEPEAVVVPFGATQDFSVAINSDGTVHQAGDAQSYETLDFSLSVKRYLTPEYYRETYGTTYQLSGAEAGVEFELLLNDYMGSQTIMPANLFTVSLENAEGVSVQGYALTATEIRNVELVVETNIPTMAYKRFDFSDDVGDIEYLVVSVASSAGTQVYKFEVGEPLRPTPTPQPTPAYDALQTGSTGDEVVRLQERLIELGYLDDTADGNFGANTEAAVTAAQADFDMEETGVADHDFQVRLYEDADDGETE